MTVNTVLWLFAAWCVVSVIGGLAVGKFLRGPRMKSEACFECMGRGWTAHPAFLADDTPLTGTLVTMLSANCDRCKGSGVESVGR